MLVELLPKRFIQCLYSAYRQYKVAFCQAGLLSEKVLIFSANSTNWQQHGASKRTTIKPDTLKHEVVYTQIIIHLLILIAKKNHALNQNNNILKFDTLSILQHSQICTKNIIYINYFNIKTMWCLSLHYLGYVHAYQGNWSWQFSLTFEVLLPVSTLPKM